jgi:hypothetical protein
MMEKKKQTRDDELCNQVKNENVEAGHVACMGR